MEFIELEFNPFNTGEREAIREVALSLASSIEDDEFCIECITELFDLIKAKVRIGEKIGTTNGIMWDLFRDCHGINVGEWPAGVLAFIHGRPIFLDDKDFVNLHGQLLANKSSGSIEIENGARKIYKKINQFLLRSSAKIQKDAPGLSVPFRIRSEPLEYGRTRLWLEPLPGAGTETSTSEPERENKAPKELKNKKLRRKS